MNELKKLFSIMLAFLMLFCMISVPASAKGEVAFRLGSAEAAPGAAVSLPVTVEGDYLAHVVNIEVHYDPANVTVPGKAGVKLGSLFPEDCTDMGWLITKEVDNDTGVVRLAVLVTDDPADPAEYQALSGSGTLFTIDFRISEGCTEDQPITLTVREFKYFPLSAPSSTPIPHTETNGMIGIDTSVPPAAEYTVTFLDRDGTVLDVQSVTEGCAASAPEAPWHEGWTFIGWDSDFSCVTGDMTVTAQYEPIPYTVTYYLDGEKYAVQTVPCGTPIEPPEVSGEGYAFSGWTLADGSAAPETMPPHDVELFGALAHVYVTVTYTGSFNGTQVLPYGGNAVLPVLDACGVHYTFTADGAPWDGVNVTENVTVTVGLEVNIYTVIFIDPIGGTVLSVQSVPHGMNASAPEAPAHTGHTFTGWDADFSCVKSDMTVTAVYDPAGCRVVFTDGFGGVISAQTVPYQQAAEAPADPVREGLIFMGWDKDFSCVEHDMTVNALWCRSFHTVTFTGVYTGSVTVGHGSDCELPVCGSPYLHYTFTVGGEPWDGKCVTADVTVTVGIEVNEVFTVTFVDRDGTVISTQRVYSGCAAQPPEPPVHEGYTFTGWSADISCVTGDMTVAAIYEEARAVGDVNCDGTVDSRDLTLAAAYSMNAGEVTEKGLLNGDMNGDGALTSADLSSLYAYIQG